MRQRRKLYIAPETAFRMAVIFEPPGGSLFFRVLFWRVKLKRAESNLGDHLNPGISGPQILHSSPILGGYGAKK